MQSSRESIARMSDTNPSWIAVATFQVNMNISSEEISPVNFLVANYCLFPSKIPGLLPKIQEFLSRELIYSICWVLNLVTQTRLLLYKNHEAIVQNLLDTFEALLLFFYATLQFLCQIWLSKGHCEAYYFLNNPSTLFFPHVLGIFHKILR